MPSQSLQRLHFFEKIAPYYDFLLDFLTLGMYERFLRKAFRILAPARGEKILDLCSGTGRLASWIVRSVGENGKVVGMDIARRMVEIAKNGYGDSKNLIFLQQDVTEPWGDQNHFDAIFISFSLHELPEKGRNGVLKQSYHALTEKGRIVIADFNPQVSGDRRILLQILFRIFERANLSFFSFEQERILGEVGFKRIQTLPILGGLFQITLVHKI